MEEPAQDRHHEAVSAVRLGGTSLLAVTKVVLLLFPKGSLLPGRGRPEFMGKGGKQRAHPKPALQAGDCMNCKAAF